MVSHYKALQRVLDVCFISVTICITLLIPMQDTFRAPKSLMNHPQTGLIDPGIYFFSSFYDDRSTIPHARLVRRAASNKCRPSCWSSCHSACCFGSCGNRMANQRSLRSLFVKVGKLYKGKFWYTYTYTCFSLYNHTPPSSISKDAETVSKIKLYMIKGRSSFLPFSSMICAEKKTLISFDMWTSNICQLHYLQTPLKWVCKSCNIGGGNREPTTGFQVLKTSATQLT